MLRPSLIFARGLLKATGVSEIQKRVEDLKGIQGAQVAYTGRINTESVIALSGE
jgi:adenylate cyclase